MTANQPIDVTQALAAARSAVVTVQQRLDALQSQLSALSTALRTGADFQQADGTFLSGQALSDAVVRTTAQVSDLQQVLQEQQARVAQLEAAVAQGSNAGAAPTRNSTPSASPDAQPADNATQQIVAGLPVYAWIIIGVVLLLLLIALVVGLSVWAVQRQRKRTSVQQIQQMQQKEQESRQSDYTGFDY